MKPPIKRHCPKCQRILYDRSLERCGFCAAPIPEDLRFSAEEKAEVDRMAAEVKMNQKIREAVIMAMPLDGNSASAPTIIPPG
jgi:hypothetical protein